MPETITSIGKKLIKEFFAGSTPLLMKQNLALLRVLANLKH